MAQLPKLLLHSKNNFCEYSLFHGIEKCSSCLCTVILHNVPHEDILYGVSSILRMVTFIYFLFDIGVFDYSAPL